MYHTLAIQNGRLYTWGSNRYGQLGDGTGGDYTNDNDKNAPLQIGNATNWTAVSAGEHSSLALNDFGELWAWGGINVGSVSAPNFPIKVPGNWVSIAAGYGTLFAINSAGELWGWGRNNEGQLGNGTNTNSTIPVQIPGIWKSVSVSYHTLAIKMNGELWSWGRNDHGQLGIGNNTNQNKPVRIGSATNWVSVETGMHHSHAINDKGELLSWGYNAYGELGLGDKTNRTSPVRVGTQTNWTKVEATGHNSMALNSLGEAYYWGVRSEYAYGGGFVERSTPLLSPTRINNSTNWKNIALGWGHVCAINNLGELYVSGRNPYGQLGLGDTTDRSTLTFAGLSVALPDNGTGYTISTTMPLAVISNGSYTFTITLKPNYSISFVKLNSPNGKLSYSGVTEDGAMIITISNVVGKITADDFVVSIYLV